MVLDEKKRIAIIVGAGPAGLTAALELLRRTDIKPIVYEADTQVGGISKTINYKGNRMDLGGHRFFSKSEWVMRWWQEILPIEAGQTDASKTLQINYQQRLNEFIPAAISPRSADAVMLVRDRLSRIFYRRHYFDYPLKLNPSTLKNLGLIETLRIGASYGHAQLAAKGAETTLEHFFINRFGKRLYRTFFKDYTEKVWGVPCADISADWGAQRIKGLSIKKAIAHALTNRFRRKGDTKQRGTETSLIERFLYPKFGPGQMWEEVSRQILSRGGEIHTCERIVGIERNGFEVTALAVRDECTGRINTTRCDHFISTMPIRDLVMCLEPGDSAVKDIALELPYRDFMTAGLLLKKMRTKGAKRGQESTNGMPPDNWIYIQEADVKLGRIQVFNNWSPGMVADPKTIWLGLEYFCNEGDDLWSMSDEKFLSFAAAELEKLGMIEGDDVLDGTVVRVPKAYPAYFGKYREFGAIRAYLDKFSNLYPIGRNGMHRYNNQDHSMLAAKCAVDSIVSGGHDKQAIWDINAEDDYHEQINEGA